MSLHREHFLRILDYCGGVISEEEFLKAEAGSRWNQCECTFYVALDRLAQGDRAGAREHFQKALDTGVFVFRGVRMEPTLPEENGTGPDLAEVDSAEGARNPADNYSVELTARSASLPDA